MNGVFISFEGPEGSGKSTHAARAARRIEALGREVVRTREPGGTRTGEMIRDILQHDRSGEAIHPETETLLFAASRAQLVRMVIRPALERGACVICDRFADSTTAYQGCGRGFGIDAMLAMNEFAVGGLWPELTLLMDIDVAAGFERMGRRNASKGVPNDRFEREKIDFHERVRHGYLELAARFPARFRIVNADRDEDAVAADVWKLIEPRLAKRSGGAA